MTRSYNVQNLLDDLKVLYRDAGTKAQGWTFILTDNEIKDEGFLEPMNNLLSCGEISGLFARDEIDEITGELISVMKKVSPKTPPTQDNLYDFFVSRARANLHIVLCFSPVGEKFQQRSVSNFISEKCFSDNSLKPTKDPSNSLVCSLDVPWIGSLDGQKML